MNINKRGLTGKVKKAIIGGSFEEHIHFTTF